MLEHYNFLKIVLFRIVAQCKITKFSVEYQVLSMVLSMKSSHGFILAKQTVLGDSVCVHFYF